MGLPGGAVVKGAVLPAVPSESLGATVLVVAQSGNTMHVHLIAYESVEYKVFAVLSNNLNMNSLIKTPSLLLYSLTVSAVMV